LLQTVRHQTASTSSLSSVPVTSASQCLPTVVLPTYKVSRRTESSHRRVTSGLGKQRARLVLPVTGDVHSRSCSGCDEDDEDDAYLEPASMQHCHCCCHYDTNCQRSCHCDTQRHAIHQNDVDESRGSWRRRSALDDDDSDPVSCIEREHITTSGLYLPPLFVTSAAERSGAQTGNVVDSMSGCRQWPMCLPRWWTQVFHRRRRDDAPRCPDDDNDDDCWRLFPGRHCGRATSRDSDNRPASAPGTASLCSSPAAADDAVDPRRTSRGGGDAVLLTQRCRRAAAAKAALGDRRRQCTRVLCVILGGLCVAVVGLLIGGLVIASPAALHYSQ